MSARKILILVSLVVQAATLGCGRAADESAAGAPAAAAGSDGLDATQAAGLATYASPDSPKRLSRVLAAEPPATVGGPTLWAMGACACTPKATAAWMAAAAARTGALPQVLMPDVRSSLKGNQTLQGLLQSQAAQTTIGKILAGLVLRGEALALEIRTEIWTRVVAALGLPATATQQSPSFALDGFLGTDAPAGAAAGDSFDVAAQTGVWQLVLGAPEIWGLASGQTGSYASFQAIHLMRLFSEWKYVFALKSDPKDAAYGGLTFALADGTALGAYDPRVAGAAPRLVSGHYTVSYPQTDPLTLAMQGNEAWARQPGAVPLEEQAQVWTAAAKALRRARPRNRTKHQKLFGDDGLLPEAAYLLPLAFLPGMQTLLQGPLLDKDAQTLHAASDGKAPASLTARVRLGWALGLWYQELGDLSDLELLDDQVKSQARSGLPDLLDGLRLTVDLIVTDGALRAGGDGLAVADVAEALTLVAWAERTLLPSPVLHDAVAADAAAFLAGTGAKAWASGKLTARDVLALAQLASELGQAASLPAPLAAAVGHLSATTAAALAGWGGP